MQQDHWVTRDSPKEERDRVLAEKQKRREARKEKVFQLRTHLKQLFEQVKGQTEIPEDIRKELLSRLEDIDISYENELESLIY